MYDRELNRRAPESLIKAGSFDSMHYYRSQLLKIVNPVVDAIAQNRKKNIEGRWTCSAWATTRCATRRLRHAEHSGSAQAGAAGDGEGDHRSVPLGHPMDEYRSLTQKAGGLRHAEIIDDLTGESSRPVYKDGMTVRLACVITAVRLKSTRTAR